MEGKAKEGTGQRESKEGGLGQREGEQRGGAGTKGGRVKRGRGRDAEKGRRWWWWSGRLPIALILACNLFVSLVAQY